MKVIKKASEQQEHKGLDIYRSKFWADIELMVSDLLTCNRLKL